MPCHVLSGSLHGRYGGAKMVWALLSPSTAVSIIYNRCAGERADYCQATGIENNESYRARIRTGWVDHLA